MIKKVWHDIDEEPLYKYGVTELIVCSNYGHIMGVAHYYTAIQWQSHVQSQRYRNFKWAYESDLMCENRLIE